MDPYIQRKKKKKKKKKKEKKRKERKKKKPRTRVSVLRGVIGICTPYVRRGAYVGVDSMLLEILGPEVASQVYVYVCAHMYRYVCVMHM